MNKVLFVCVHHAGRSQMAEAFFNRLAQERGLDARAESAGTEPGDRVHPEMAAAMRELGIDSFPIPFGVTVWYSSEHNAAPATASRDHPLQINRIGGSYGWLRRCSGQGEAVAHRQRARPAG